MRHSRSVWRRRIRVQTDLLPLTSPDLQVIRASAKRQTRRRASGWPWPARSSCWGPWSSPAVTDAGPDRATGIEPIGTPAPSPTPSQGGRDHQEGVDHLRIRSVRLPASVILRTGPRFLPPRRWTFDGRRGGCAEPRARRPCRSGPARSAWSAWNAPLEAPAGSTVCPDLTDRACVESIAFLTAWARGLCEASGNTPCRGIEDRATELCLEKWDCHPGLLVPFRDDVQAFFSGGIYDARCHDRRRGLAGRVGPVRRWVRGCPAASRSLPVDHGGLARIDPARQTSLTGAVHRAEKAGRGPEPRGHRPGDLEQRGKAASGLGGDARMRASRGGSEPVCMVTTGRQGPSYVLLTRARTGPDRCRQPVATDEQ